MVLNDRYMKLAFFSLKVTLNVPLGDTAATRVGVQRSNDKQELTI